jgi:hypothetical protein
MVYNTATQLAVRGPWKHPIYQNMLKFPSILQQERNLFENFNKNAYMSFLIDFTRHFMNKLGKGNCLVA